METDQKKLQQLIELMEKNNCPVCNLWRGDFLTEEMKGLYSDLTTNIEHFKLWKFLEEKVNLDPNRIQKYYLWDVAVEQRKGIVFETYPELKDKLDKDGLIEISRAGGFNKNGFPYKQHYLIFEDLLSRNFHLTNWLRKKLDNEARLFAAIDDNRLGLSDTVREVFLKAHWQGPTTIQKLKDLFVVNELIVKATNKDLGPFIDKTEFLFTKQGKETHLEIEELIPLHGIRFEEKTHFKDKAVQYYTRYMHAILDKDLEKCYHLDGAIREYGNLQNYLERNKGNLKQNWKEKSNRYKVFKISAEKGMKQYQEIIGLYFTFNSHVMEFFDGETDFSKDIEKRRGGILEIDLDSKGLISNVI